VTDDVLVQAFIYLAAAVVCVPLAKKLGLGSVLGYLLGGVLIGPYALGFVGTEGHHLMHFAEFGVVMMLFLVGLELKPTLLWQLRRPILGMGGLQVVVTIAVIGGVAMAVGLPWKEATAVGMILAMSSTAIVLQSLAEKGLLKSPGGQASFSVLLFQDIAVIPILAVFPLLAMGTTLRTTTSGGLPAWEQALLVIGAVALLILAGRFVVKPFFRLLAQTRLREVFTAFALFLVVAIALLMQQVGMSPALGTFLAGVVLAESEYRHELESDIEPFKGLLLGLFFISVGAQIDFRVIAAHPFIISGLVFGVVAIKLGVLYGLARLFGLDRPARWLFAFGLAQVGEFAFVLYQYGLSNHVLSPEITAPLVAVTALTMALTPLLFIVFERVVLPRVTGGDERAQDEIVDAHNPVVIAGFGRFGQVVGRLLKANRIGATVLDLDPNMVDVLGRLGFKVYYGDASRPELLHAAGCEHARLFVLAVDDVEVSTTIAHMVRQHYPNLPILGRARNRQHYYALHRAGVKKIFRETLGSACEMAAETLHELGMRAHTAYRLAQAWRRHDEKALEQLGALWGGDQGVYFAQARRMVDEAERLISNESPKVFDEVEAEWDNETLREEVAAVNGVLGQPVPEGKDSGSPETRE
jgi:glutathione-regulated potassium-efflux system ancillary protein KefC